MNDKEHTLAGKTILLVEDDELISKMYSKRFSANGACVLVAFDGTQGLKILENQKVDLILLDLGMPGMDGYEMFRKIKADERVKDTPIVILSNTTMNEKREEFQEIINMGVKDIFRKYELSLDDLMKQLQHYFTS